MLSLSCAASLIVTEANAACVYKPIMTNEDMAKCQQSAPKDEPPDPLLRPLDPSERVAPRKPRTAYRGSNDDLSSGYQEGSGSGDWGSTCDSVGELAEIIMTKRHEGVSMSQLMEIARTEDGPGSELVQIMVTMAFDRPRFETVEVQRRSIEEFRDDLYLMCVKRLKFGT